MDEFLVDDAGFFCERAARNTAEWYSSFGQGDRETFEAAIMLVRATRTMLSVPNGPTQDVGQSRYHVLRLVYMAAGRRLQMGEIGEALDVSPTHVTKIVDGLEDDGLLRRVRDEQDKRRTWAELTGEGLALVERVLPEMIESTVKTWRLFSREEKRLLAHLMTKLRLSIRLEQSQKLPEQIVRSLGSPD